jgi:hypothetical protein
MMHVSLFVLVLGAVAIARGRHRSADRMAAEDTA